MIGAFSFLFYVLVLVVLVICDIDWRGGLLARTAWRHDLKLSNFEILQNCEIRHLFAPVAYSEMAASVPEARSAERYRLVHSAEEGARSVPTYLFNKILKCYNFMPYII